MENFSKKEALSFAFNTLKSHFWRIIGFIVLIYLISLALQIISEGVEMPFLIQVIFSIMTWAVSIIISMGFIRFCLAYADNREGSFSDIYSCYSLFWKYLAVSFLYGLIVIGGLFLLIIPGFIWAYKFYFSQYLVIDKGMGPIAALKESSRITKGHKGNLFIFSLVFVGLLIAVMAILILFILVVAIPSLFSSNALLGLGVPTLIIPLIILYALFVIILTAFSALAYVYVYRRLSIMNVSSSVPTVNPELPTTQPENPSTL